MPLDIAGFVLPKLSSFDQLGLLPIEGTRAERWRQLVAAEFAKQSSGNAHLVEVGRARWAMALGRKTVDAYLASAPADVRYLANEIRAAVPQVQLGVEWFYTDPILYAIEADAYHCVAIWNRGIVRAIAHGARLSRTQKLLRRFVRTV